MNGSRKKLNRLIIINSTVNWLHIKILYTHLTELHERDHLFTFLP